MNKIGDHAFSGCEWLEEITLSSCLEYIGTRSFGNCKISDILLPNTLKFIGSEAFYSCSKLKKIIIPSSVTEIKENVFSWCSSIEKIYCRSENKPDGWSDNWIGVNTTKTIIWNYKD